MLAASIRSSAVTVLLLSTGALLTITHTARLCSADRATRTSSEMRAASESDFSGVREHQACRDLSRLMNYNAQGGTRYVLPDRILLRWWALPFPLALFAAGLVEGVIVPSRTRLVREPTRAGKWYLLRHSEAQMARARTWRTLAAAYWLGWLVAILIDAQHWGFSATALRDSWGGLLFGVGLLAISLVFSSVHWFIAQPSVAVSRWPLVRGSEVVCQLAIPTKHRVNLEHWHRLPHIVAEQAFQRKP